MILSSVSELLCQLLSSCLIFKKARNAVWIKISILTYQEDLNQEFNQYPIVTLVSYVPNEWGPLSIWIKYLSVGIVLVVRDAWFGTSRGAPGIYIIILPPGAPARSCLTSWISSGRDSVMEQLPAHHINKQTNKKQTMRYVVHYQNGFHCSLWYFLFRI